MMLGHDKRHGVLNYFGIHNHSWAVGEPHPPWQGEDKVFAISLAKGATHAANLSCNQSLPPCVSESRLLQTLFLAAQQGSGPSSLPKRTPIKATLCPSQYLEMLYVLSGVIAMVKSIPLTSAREGWVSCDLL